MSEGAQPEREVDDDGSGPYCKHWETPGECEACAVELLRNAGYEVVPPSRSKSPG